MKKIKSFKLLNKIFSNFNKKNQGFKENGGKHSNVSKIKYLKFSKKITVSNNF